MAIWKSQHGSRAAVPFIGALICVASVAHGQAPAKTNLKKILVLEKSRFGSNAHMESRADCKKALAELALEKGFSITSLVQNDPASKTVSEFSQANLASYQAVVFNHDDGFHILLDAASKANLEAYVRNGGGLIPIHSETGADPIWPWMASVHVESFYGPHGSNQPTANVAHDAEGTQDGTETQGIFKGLTAPLAFQDEYFSFRASPRGRPDVTILLTVDEKTFSKLINAPMGEDHPVVWAKREGKGRVVNMSMGHSWSTNNVFTAKNSYLKYFLYGTLRYLSGDFIGCTDNAYAEHSPDATKSDPALCITPANVPVRFDKHPRQNLAALISRNESGGLVDVEFFSAGSHEVAVKDISGRQVYRKTGSGQARFSVPTPGKSGVYIIEARAGGMESTHRATVL